MALRGAFPDAFDRVPAPLLLAGAATLPMNLASSQFQGVLLGLGRIRPFNAIEALDRLVLLGGSLVLRVAGVRRRRARALHGGVRQRFAS